MKLKSKMLSIQGFLSQPNMDEWEKQRFMNSSKAALINTMNKKTLIIIIVILIIVLFVPMFSSMMIRGAGGMSGAGGAILGIGSAVLVKQMTKGMRGLKDHFRDRPLPKQNLSYRSGA